MTLNLNEHTIVANARRRFDKELHTKSYTEVHSDSTHLENLIGIVDVQKNKRYLDIGTGNGYVAFDMAKRFPDIFVTGLDIAENAIEQNGKIKQEKNLKNIDFSTYCGTNIPMDNNSFYGIIIRYALHHFPNIVLSISEMRRVLEHNGFVIISDPITYDDDSSDFINQFHKLRKDGHVCFYRICDLMDLFGNAGFNVEEKFFSYLSFTKELTSAHLTLLKNTPKGVLDKYKSSIQEKEIHVTVSVINIMFKK